MGSTKRLEGTEYKVSAAKIYNHEGFEEHKMLNDIALIETPDICMRAKHIMWLLY